MNAYPRGRILLRFDRQAKKPDDFRLQLSACALDNDGKLWLATDELNGLSRLKEQAPGAFAKHVYTDIQDHLQLLEEDKEIDIEGLDIQDDAIWFVGSHTSTRKKVKAGKDDEGNLKRLTQVEINLNRFLIACARLKDGELDKDEPIAQLPIDDDGNALSKALRADPHLGPFMCTRDQFVRDGCGQIASKENGFDIEGAAVRGRRLFVGLRGPVLRGWALLIELQLGDDGDGQLTLDRIGRNGRPYRKHFIALDGMGIRDLLWQGDDLLILAGPTMNITGLQSLYRFRYAADLADDSISELDGIRLQLLFHLPQVNDGDKAEGICRYDDLSALDGAPGILVVYDAPRSDRLVADDAVLADVFALPGR